MSAPLGTYGAVKDYKRFKQETYDAYLSGMGEQTLKDMQQHEELTREKITQLKNKQNPPLQQIEELENHLKIIEDGIIYGRSIQEAVKNAPENVTSDLLDLLVEKQLLIDSKDLKGDMIYAPGELKKINKKIAELDKKIESTEVYDNYVNESKEKTEEKINAFYGENSDIEIIETVDNFQAAEEIEIALNEQLIKKNEEIRELQKQNENKDVDSETPLMNTTDIIKKRQERNSIRSRIQRINKTKEDVEKDQNLGRVRNVILNSFEKYKKENEGSGKTDQELYSDFEKDNNKTIKDGGRVYSPKQLIEKFTLGRNQINQSEGLDGFYSNGFITQTDLNGKRKIIINKKQALKSG